MVFAEAPIQFWSSPNGEVQDYTFTTATHVLIQPTTREMQRRLGITGEQIIPIPTRIHRSQTALFQLSSIALHVMELAVVRRYMLRIIGLR